MCLLFGASEPITTYSQSKPQQKLIRENAVLQLVELVEEFYKDTKIHKEATKFGTEIEGFSLYKIQHNGKPLYSVCLDNLGYVNENNPRHNDHIEISIEFTGWMIEMMPKRPYSGLLNYHGIYQHFHYIAKKLTNIGGNSFKLLISGSLMPHKGRKTII